MIEALRPRGALARITARAWLYPLLAVVIFQLGYVNRRFVELPRPLLWLPHLLLVMALAALLYAWRREKLLPADRLPGRLLWVMLAIAAVHGLSALANGSPPLTALLAGRGWFVFFGSLVAFRLARFNSDEHERWQRWLVWAALLQLPVVAAQRLFLVSRLGTPDAASGTFASDAYLSFLQPVAVCLVLQAWLSGRRRLVPGHPLVLTALLIAPLALSNSRAAWVYLPVCIATLLLRHALQDRRRALIAAAVVGGQLLAGAAVFESVYQSYYSRIGVVYLSGNPVGRIRYYLFGATDDAATPDNSRAEGNQGNQEPQPGREVRRGNLVRLVYSLVSVEPRTLILGLGPGSFSESSLPGATGVYAGREGVDFTRGLIAPTLGELGLAGLIVTAWLFLELYLSLAEPAGWRGRDWRVVYQVVLLLMLLQTIFVNVFASPLHGLTLAVLGSAYTPPRRTD